MRFLVVLSLAFAPACRESALPPVEAPPDLMPVDPPPGEQVAAGGCPLSVVATGDGVAWVDRTVDDVWSLRRGGAPERLARNQTLRWCGAPVLAAGGGHVSWFSYDWRVRDGGGICDLVEAQLATVADGEIPHSLTPTLSRPGNLVADEEAVYWTAPGGLWRGGLDGAPATQLAPGDYGSTTLALVDDQVFAIRRGSELVAIPRRGGPTSMVYVGKSMRLLAGDGRNLFWVEDLPTQRLLRMIPADGREVTSIHTEGDGEFLNVTPPVSDGAFVYWADLRRIVRLPVEGGVAQEMIVLNGRGTLFDVALDGGFLYWTLCDTPKRGETTVSGLYRERL